MADFLRSRSLGFLRTSHVLIVFMSVAVIAFVGSSFGLQAQSFRWSELEGPYGGMIEAFAESPNGTLYASSNTGIVRSTDGGSTWTERFEESEHITAEVAFDDGIVMAISRDKTWLVRNYKDFGSWFRYEFYYPLDARYAYNAATLDGTFYLGTDNGLALSRDTGQTWEHVAYEGYEFRSICVTDSVFAGVVGLPTVSDTVGLIVRSFDRGSTWESIALVGMVRLPELYVRGDRILVRFPGTEYEVLGLYSWPIDSDTLAPFDTTPHEYGWVVTEILGNGDVAVIDTNPWDFVLYGPNGEVKERHRLPFWISYATTLYCASDGALYAGTMGAGIHRSTDNGQTWKQVGLESAAEVDDLIPAGNGEYLAAVWNRGLYRVSEDGEWSLLGPESGQFRSVAIDSSGGYWGAERSRVRRSTDQGMTWKDVPIDTPHDFEVVAAPNDSTILLGLSGGILRSTDNGATWEQVHSGVQIAFLETAPNGSIFGARGQFVCRSDDGGATWTDLEFLGGSQFPSAESMLATRSGSILVQGFDELQVLRRSSDNGETWVTLEGGCPTWWFDTMIEADDGIYGLSLCGLYRSTDEGESWEFLIEPPEYILQAKLVLRPDGGLYLAAGSKGIFRLDRSSGVLEWKKAERRLDLR